MLFILFHRGTAPAEAILLLHHPDAGTEMGQIYFRGIETSFVRKMCPFFTVLMYSVFFLILFSTLRKIINLSFLLSTTCLACKMQVSHVQSAPLFSLLREIPPSSSCLRKKNLE